VGGFAVKKTVSAALVLLLSLSSVESALAAQPAVQGHPRRVAEEGKAASQLVYHNTAFGFDFLLPPSWQGYSIVPGQWQGMAAGPEEHGPVETGPMISIRHPGWTAKVPRQDIPIMVFTISQWNALQAGEFHIGAAPVGPSELGRNSMYVFALPARYNFAFPPGYEEVQQILAGKPLQPTEPHPK
jgi:hypothetical protein